MSFLHGTRKEQPTVVKKRFATTGEIAKICEVSPKTIITWIEKKHLPSFRIGNGPRKVILTDLFEFLSSRNFPVADLGELENLLEAATEKSLSPQ